jgi:hypothetical protein
VKFLSSIDLYSTLIGLDGPFGGLKHDVFSSENFKRQRGKRAPNKSTQDRRVSGGGESFACTHIQSDQQ